MPRPGQPEETVSLSLSLAPASLSGTTETSWSAPSQGTDRSAEPLGPALWTSLPSTSRRAAVAASVAQVTLTVPSPPADGHSRSPTVNDVTSAAWSPVSVVSVVCVVPPEAGQSESSVVPSVRLVPQSGAPSRFVPEIVAPSSVAPVRSASERSVSTTCAPSSFASLRSAPLRFGGEGARS